MGHWHSLGSGLRIPPPVQPINSWDRMPFLTRIRSGGGPASYAPASTDTANNAIIANYGASQGFDNDDGSSFYNTHDNWYWDAAGFKVGLPCTLQVFALLLY